MRNQEFCLVLIETASNQKTIFQTNRLRENIGASGLIHRVGTRYVIEALGFPAVFATLSLCNCGRCDDLDDRAIRLPTVRYASRQLDKAERAMYANLNKMLAANARFGKRQ